MMNVYLKIFMQKMEAENQILRKASELLTVNLPFHFLDCSDYCLSLIRNLVLFLRARDHLVGRLARLLGGLVQVKVIDKPI